MLDEACNLLLHHVRRQSGIQNDDKRKIKQLLKHFIPDLFKHARMELSDDETESGIKVCFVIKQTIIITYKSYILIFG